MLCLSVCLVYYCPYCHPKLRLCWQAGNKEQHRQTNRALIARREQNVLPRNIFPHPQKNWRTDRMWNSEFGARTQLENIDHILRWFVYVDCLFEEKSVKNY